MDIDGVLATVRQFYMKKKHEIYNCYSFDPKCVIVFNKILEATKPTIILSSDWKLHYPIESMNNIFEYNKVAGKVFDVTDDLWDGAKFRSVDQLEEVRATEILKYVKDWNITQWVAIDDLNLSPFLPEKNFVQTPRISEGIKQSGIKEKILKRLL